MTLASRSFPRFGGAALLVALAVGGCQGRHPHATELAPPSSGTPSPAILDGSPALEIDLSHGVPEEAQSLLFGSASHHTHIDLVRTFRSIADGVAPKGIFVRLGGAQLGLARAQEIGTLLAAVRKRGQPIVCHADEYNNGTLFLAARGCTKLWVSPAGGVEAIGIAAQLLYAKRLLDKLHIGVDFLQVGKYKGAEEPYTRDGPSPEARETLEGALHGLRAAWLAGIAEGRGNPALADLAEDGPFTPQGAKDVGLVDEVGYADDARDALKKASCSERILARFGGSEGSPPVSRGLAGMLRVLTGSAQSASPRVAVLPAIGAIAMTSTQKLPLGGSDGITEHDLGRAITRLTADASVKAVVIRIDSPGGSALASDLLWKKLMKLREKKPVVFSVGGMAASGGYYLACTGTRIIAEPTSILGSIGVVGGKLALGSALEQFGVHAETIAAATDPKKAARSSYMSAFTPWDDATRAKVLASMTSVYELFLRRIAEGRGTTVEKIAPSAEGRVFGGVEAKERGLVDQLGGLDDALNVALKLGGLPEDAPFEVIGDSGGGLLELLEGNDAEAGAAAAVAGAQAAAREAMVPGWGDPAPEVKAFLGSMAPLMAGEKALAAVPFGVLIR